MKNLTISTMLGFAATTAAMVLGSAPANAANFSFTGSFAGDADTQSFFFTANGASTVNLRSYSYAGGTNAAGTVIAAGGFDPILSLFDGTDNLIRTVDDGPNLVPADPVTGLRYDTNFSQALVAGNYRVVVSQFNNFATGPNFSNGFPKSAADFTGTYNCSNRQFCDVGGNNRTSAWAFDVLGVDTASIPPTTAVPEPSDLLGTALAGFAVIGLKRKLASGKQAKLKISR